jgi:hypothetical protein
VLQSIMRAIFGMKDLANAKNAVGAGAAGGGGNGPPDTPAFAKGTSFMVGGKPGVDKNLVRFRASHNERVDVLTPKQQKAQAAAMNAGRGETNVYMTVNTPDAESFNRSRRQIASDLGAMIG